MGMTRMFPGGVPAVVAQRATLSATALGVSRGTGLCRATVALCVSAAWKPMHRGPGRSGGGERLKAGPVVEGFDDLFGPPDRADEQEGEQLFDWVVTTRGVVHVLAGGALGARPAPLPDGHVRRDGAFHRRDGSTYKLLPDR